MSSLLLGYGVWVLIVLRGNSGSGKSTVARLVQAKLAGPAAVLHQDYFHRVIFREQGTAGMAHADLLEAAAPHCLGAGQHVVMDGIFNARQYEDVLARIAGRADDARLYAFDLTFEETVHRFPLRTLRTGEGAPSGRPFERGPPWIREGRMLCPVTDRGAPSVPTSGVAAYPRFGRPAHQPGFARRGRLTL